MRKAGRSVKMKLCAWLLVPVAAFAGFSSLANAQNSELDALRTLALELVNEARAKEGLPALKLEAKLNEASLGHARDMLARNYYAHESPEGKTVSDRFQAAGGSKWLLTAENIAKCDGCAPPLTRDHVRQMQDGWMNSPGHRANILRKGLETFGFGMTVNGGGTLYAVQNFAGPGTPHGDGKAADLRPISPEKQLDIVLEAINQRRKAAGVTPLEPSFALSEGARKLAPDPGDADFKVEGGGNIYDSLAGDEQKNWATLTVLTVSCGGCGVDPVKADVADFAGRWLEHPEYGAMLSSAEVTHIGFAMVADGKGRKLGVGLIGEHR